MRIYGHIPNQSSVYTESFSASLSQHITTFYSIPYNANLYFILECLFFISGLLIFVDRF